ncbi:MAG: methyltransferase domain-containing protein [Candidatus Lokiarchaeota archaeon]|nr:methyltransferase domain-containing protein [Candidatus Lokiarchaeota archaeon]
MKRKGIYEPTVEDIIEISGIEALHPGGMALTQRTAELSDLKPGMRVLDVSSGRGTQSIFYAKEFGVEVTGLDISEEMIKSATQSAKNEGVENLIYFKLGDSQDLPFDDNSFDVVINECAVGIPDDSQKVLDEMVRVTKPNGVVVIHESTWRKKLSDSEKDEISERYGTTPLEYDEWIETLKKAGVSEIITEFDEWSKPEMFWKIRKDQDVEHYTKVLSKSELATTIERIIKKYGQDAVHIALENQRKFWEVVLNGTLGYCLFKGIKK